MKRVDFNALPERFRHKIIVQRGTNCWIWIGGTHPKGYGRYAVTHNLTEYAHRFAHEFFFGPIPKHLQCDHLCRNKRCVNPIHIEITTGHINTMRGMNFPIMDGQHCQKGHPLFGKNLYMEGSIRRCRICGNERAKRYYHNKNK
jgi:HNH endonuclease